MKHNDFNSMSVDELWGLGSEIRSALEGALTSEKAKLEERLRQLQSNDALGVNSRSERRPYPQVFPKYQNPTDPTETWAGRGKQPRWLTAQLRTGKKLDEFRIYGTARQLGGGSTAKRADDRS